MRTVLLVSYTFPPQYDVSAKRAAKLCKYLPTEGWHPVVLTKDWTTDVSPEDRQAYTVTSYPAALDELPGVKVVCAPYRTHDNPLRRLHQRLGGAYASSERAGSGEARVPAAWSPVGLTRRALSAIAPTFGDFPDAFRGWTDSAVRTGLELVRRERVDAIVSLCPPATAHVVASEVARRTGLPWVAQFDDLFSFHLESEPRVSWRWYSSRAHRRWLAHAALAGAITPGMVDYVRRTYDLDGGVVMAGFDPDETPSVAPRRRERLQLVYTGSVYLDDQRPELLFEALEQVLASRQPHERCVELVFAGTRRDAELRERAARFPLAAAACTFIERVSPDVALLLQRGADGLILLNYTARAANGTLSFPAKSFEYLNAGRPVLALPRDPGGWGDAMLSSTRAGIAANDVDEAAAVLDRWLRCWSARGSVPYEGDLTEIARYGQPRQAAALAQLLDRAVATRTRT